MSKSNLTLGKSGERPEFKTKANGANRRLVADRVSLASRLGLTLQMIEPVSGPTRLRLCCPVHVRWTGFNWNYGGAISLVPADESNTRADYFSQTGTKKCRHEWRLQRR